ncbi:MAG: DNA mismatch repair endonuclease MutL, partial [Parafilimonas sp.]
EALASIAAVGQVQLKTRRAEDELGVYLEIENSVVQKQEPCACAIGTNICMKNLFFNVPARRNFLKTNAAEMRHVVDEFIHVSLAFPQLFFSLVSNGQQVFHLEAGSHKQRFLQLLGSQYNTKLVPVKEQTDYLNIYGFVGKPDAARKTRGDQYFFVNNRFIRSAYLNHAVMNAFDALLPKDSFPLYVLFIELDPSLVDINVHPTKQEIKFEDEKIVYAFVQAAVKHALAQFSIAPSLDFTLNAEIQQTEAVSKPFTEDKKEAATETNLYKAFTQKHQAHLIEPGERSELRSWQSAVSSRESEVGSEKLTVDSWQLTGKPLTTKDEGLLATINDKRETRNDLVQLHNTYLIVSVQSGFLLVHQQLAHERVLYERYNITSLGKRVATQQSLFPVTLELSAQDAILLYDLLFELNNIGYNIEPFGKNSFVIQGTPADVLQGNEKNCIESLIEQFKHFSNEMKFSKREKVIRCLARQHCIKAGQGLSQKEMQTLVEELFQCKVANVTPSGNTTYIEFSGETLVRMFGK